MDTKLVKDVIELVESVPKGKVSCYGQIAALLSRPKNARLIGRVLREMDRYGAHPCHRVVHSDGRLVDGWWEQRDLLSAEGVTFLKSGRVDMKKHLWNGEL